MTNPAANASAETFRPVRPDFPTWLPPMLVKELRQGLRTRGFVGLFVVFQVVMVLMMVGTLVSGSVANPAARAAAFNGVNSFFWVMMTVQLLVGTPLRAMGSLRTEIDSKGLDLLVLTRLSAWRIVLGKWGSLVAQAALLLIAMLPYGVVRYFGGSVDLVQDAERCLALLGGCAAVTAIAIWASALPRIMQIVVPVTIVVTLQFSTVMARSGGPGFMPFRVSPALWWFNGAVVMVFFLATAVRGIAPAADNHAPFTRAVTFLPLLAVPPAMFSSITAAKGQFIFAAIFLAVVSAIELATVRLPMPVHWQPWSRRGPLGRLAGRFALPGWPSGLFYALLAGVVIVAFAGWPGVFTSAELAEVRWQTVLALGAIVFPIILMDFLPHVAEKAPGGMYVIIIGALSIVAALVTSTAENTWLYVVAQVLPVSSFWLSLKLNGSSPIMVGQGVIVVVVVAIALLQARVHWQQLRMVARRAAMAQA